MLQVKEAVEYLQLFLLVNINVLSWVQLPEDHRRWSYVCYGDSVLSFLCFGPQINDHVEKQERQGKAAIHH